MPLPPGIVALIRDCGRTERGFRNMEEVGLGETGMVPPTR